MCTHSCVCVYNFVEEEYIRGNNNKNHIRYSCVVLNKGTDGSIILLSILSTVRVIWPGSIEHLVIHTLLIFTSLRTRSNHSCY